MGKIEVYQLPPFPQCRVNEVYRKLQRSDDGLADQFRREPGNEPNPKTAGHRVRGQVAGRFDMLARSLTKPLVANPDTEFRE